MEENDRINGYPRVHKTYVDDLLAITRGSLEDHLDRKVLIRSRDAGSTVNAIKSLFYAVEINILAIFL